MIRFGEDRGKLTDAERNKIESIIDWDVRHYLEINWWILLLHFPPHRHHVVQSVKQEIEDLTTGQMASPPIYEANVDAIDETAEMDDNVEPANLVHDRMHDSLKPVPSAMLIGPALGTAVEQLAMMRRENARLNGLSDDATNYGNGEGEPRVNKRNHSTSNRSTLVVACTSSSGGSGTTTATVHVATELKNIGFRVLVIDLDSQANTTTIMRSSYNVPLQTNAGVLDFLRHKTEHHWEIEDIDHARACITALVSDDTGGKLDLLMASSEVGRRVTARGSVYEDAHLCLRHALINSGCVRTGTYQTQAYVISSHIKDEFVPYDFIIIDTPWNQDGSLVQAMFAASSIIGCARPVGVDSYRGLFDLIDRHNGHMGSNTVKVDVVVSSPVDINSKGEIESETIKPLVDDMKADAVRRDFKLVLIPRTEKIITGVLQRPLVNDIPATEPHAQRTLSVSLSTRNAILGFQLVAQILAAKQQGVL